MKPAPARALLAALGATALACGGASAPQPAAPTPLADGLRATLIGTETRQALLLKPEEPPEGPSFRVALPASPSLTFGFGLPDRPLKLRSTAGHFEFAIDAGEGWQVIGHRRVDPSVFEDRHWFNATMDLSAWAGREVALRFRVLPDPGSLAPTGAIANPTILSAGWRDERPNLLLVSLDTLRARNVGAYGYARDTTPFLDSFARRGALFETAITTSVTTGPSHMSLFTGLYPVNHGMRSGKELKHDDVRTLASYLEAAGYQTAAFTEDGFIVRRFGFGEGFSEYTENRSTRRESPGEVRVTFDQAQRWIANRARRPFFTFVHTYQVHAPYLPPPPYAELYGNDGLAAPGSEVMRKARDNYDREIRFLDDMLRLFFGSLETQGVLENTLVVVLSDHGEEFTEHGYYQHGGAVFEETLRVPLVFVGPGVEPGRRVTTQVSLIDVLPTVLDLLGVEGAGEADGVSLADALRGGPEPAERTLFAEANAPKRWLQPFSGEAWHPPLIAVRRQQEKFIVHRPRDGGPADPTRHYDLADDALERNPRAIEPDALARVDALVDDYLRGRTPRAESPAQDIEPELAEHLRALGYLDAPTAGEAAPEARPEPAR